MINLAKDIISASIVGVVAIIVIALAILAVSWPVLFSLKLLGVL